MASIYIMMINSVLRWKWEASWRQLKSSMVITTTGSRYGYLCLITQRGLFESPLLLWNLGSCRVFRLNLGERGEHFTRQLSWVAAWLLVTRVCPVYLVDELVLVVLIWLDRENKCVCLGNIQTVIHESWLVRCSRYAPEFSQSNQWDSLTHPMLSTAFLSFFEWKVNENLVITSS